MWPDSAIEKHNNEMTYQIPHCGIICKDIIIGRKNKLAEIVLGNIEPGAIGSWLTSEKTI
jgi:hypothetical protein